MASNPAGASRLQSLRPVRRVAELRSLGGITRYETPLPKVPASPLQPPTQELRVLRRIYSRGASFHAGGDGGTRTQSGRLGGGTEAETACTGGAADCCSSCHHSDHYSMTMPPNQTLQRL